MELSLKILTELVVLPHWQLLAMVAVTLVSCTVGVFCLFFAMRFKAEADVKEIEIVYLYQENNKLRSEVKLL